ncbi:MAG: hypothetical protein HQK54_17910 [Oligoflexales bacterium]|nr:hypothetical protein [Oligoflexales bacterium]
MEIRRKILLFSALLAIVRPDCLAAGSAMVPVEYELSDDSDLATGYSGVAYVPYPSSTILINPALMASGRRYLVSGGLFSPRENRPFYRASIVDSVTSRMALGIGYSGVSGKFSPERAIKNNDAHTVRRISGGAAFPFQLYSIGISVQWVEGYGFQDDLWKVKRGQSYGMGLSSPQDGFFRWGVSWQNVGNSKISEFAARSFRAGIGLLAPEDKIGLHVEYRTRERFLSHEGNLSYPGDTSLKDDLGPKESLLTAMATGRLADQFFASLAYGMALPGSSRRLASFGFGGRFGKYSLSYMMMRPYLSSPRVAQGIHLSCLLL